MAVAARLIGEEMEIEITIEQQHGERCGEDREGGNDEQIRGERGPAEDRHAHVVHARSAGFENGRHQVDAPDQRTGAGYLQGPEVIVDADARRVLQLGQRRIRQPAGAGELADHEGDIDQQRTGRGEPEPHGVERREGDVTHAELQRHHEVHQSDHERHGDEEYHDRAVRGEDLIVVLRRQVARPRGRRTPVASAS